MGTLFSRRSWKQRWFRANGSGTLGYFAGSASVVPLHEVPLRVQPCAACRCAPRRPQASSLSCPDCRKTRVLGSGDLLSSTKIFEGTLFSPAHAFGLEFYDAGAGRVLQLVMHADTAAEKDKWVAYLNRATAAEEAPSTKKKAHVGFLVPVSAPVPHSPPEEDEGDPDDAELTFHGMPDWFQGGAVLVMPAEDSKEGRPVPTFDL